MQAPYETILDVTIQGTHNIFVIATDILGYSETSTLTNFEVEYIDITDPTGFVAYPADWTDVSGTFEARIIAFDNIEVNRVELFVDGIYWNELSAAPYNFSIDSTTLSNENHTIYAIVYDTSENSFITQMVNIRVDN
jgi:Big-like domain-containing protein